MAIGDGNNYGNQENKYDPTYYSRFRFARNNELGMSISYRSGLMILEINKLDDGFKSSPVESIYLSPTKAAMLSGQLDKFLKYRDGDDISLMKVFKNIYDKQNGALLEFDPKKADKAQLQSFMETALPEYDRDRVYPNDMRKLALWYNILVKNGMTDFVNEEEEVSEEKAAE